MKINKAQMAIGGGLIALVAIAGVTLFGGAKEPTYMGPKEGKLVQVSEATIRDVQTKISATGILDADSKETIYAQSGNKIVTVHKKVGDEVTKGDLLFTLDKEVKEKLEKEVAQLTNTIETATANLALIKAGGTKQELLQARSNVAELEKLEADLTESLRSMKASVETAKIGFTAVEANYAVVKQLFEEGLASQKELDDAKIQYEKTREDITSLENKVASITVEQQNLALKKDTATYTLSVLENPTSDANKALMIKEQENNLKSLNTQKENLLIELEKAQTAIVAPMSGSVAAVNVEDGASITVGTPLMTIIAPDQLKVTAEISAFYSPQLTTGLDATIKYSGSEIIETTAKVVRVAPVAAAKAGASTNTPTITVELLLDGKEEGLKAGLAVDIKLIAKDVADAVTIPLLATLEDEEGANYLLVVKDDYTIEKRYINQGTADSLFVEVENVAVGEKVVTNPTESMTDGDVVKYLDYKVKQGE